MRVYEEDTQITRESAPDRRFFLYQSKEGAVRSVKGYRGSGEPLARRALPVYDARLVTNLVFSPSPGLLLDPFAGAGGIALEALATGWRVLTIDNDPSLRFGLAALGADHILGDAAFLLLAGGSVDAVATEPPYHPAALSAVVHAFREMRRVVKPGGKIAMLSSQQQASALRSFQGESLELQADVAIDRKGPPTVVLLWEKAT